MDQEERRWREWAHKILDLAAEGASMESPAANDAGGHPPPPADPPRCEAPVTPPNPEWRWLSPLEEQILAVTTAEYRTAEDLAARLKVRCTSDFRIILRNMVARCILDSSGEGYRIRERG